MTATASPAQIRRLIAEQRTIRDEMRAYPSLVKKFDARLWRIAQGAASAAEDGPEEIADYLVTRPWLTIAPCESRDDILARITALRAEIADLTDEQLHAMDSRTISRYIDAAKALHQ